MWRMLKVILQALALFVLTGILASLLTVGTPLAASPEVWFCPFMYGQPSAPWQNGFGAKDYLDLFDANAPWAEAAKRVQVFKMYMFAIDGLSNAQLRRLVVDLNRRGIALALEVQPLTGSATSEAFAADKTKTAAEATELRIRRIESVGGSVRFLAMDEPLTFGPRPAPEGAALSVEQVAAQVYEYVSIVSRAFPGIVIGDIEYEAVGLEASKAFLEAYRKASGTPMPFLHWDVNWRAGLPATGSSFNWPDWPERAKALETYCREHGTKFGMIYNGNFDATSDAEWIGQAVDHVATYEGLGGNPDHAIFQSWHRYPQHVLPETDPTAFTHLIADYLNPAARVAISVSESPAGRGSQVAGRIADQTGAPIGGASLRLVARPTEGTGWPFEYTAEGTVPANAQQALVGFRANAECDCSGRSEFQLYKVRYEETGKTVQGVPNGNFTRGLDGWGYLTQKTVRLRASDRGGGSMLQVKAAPGEPVTINSSTFAVTAGASYRVTFDARVTLVSEPVGYFAIFFLGKGSEIARHAVAIEPPCLTYQAVSDASGAFQLTLTGIPSGHFVLQAESAPDSDHWPGYARIDLQN